MDKVRVGITQGDINGVGYEVIMKALAEDGVPELFTPVIFGHKSIAQKAIDTFGLSTLRLNVINNLDEINDDKINLFELETAPPQLKPGEVDKEAGDAAVASLEKAVEALNSGDIDVVVTAPISKEAVQSERFNFPGHTEFFSHRLSEEDNRHEAMMILCNEDLRVALLTKHVPLSQIPEAITREGIIEAVEKFSATLKQDFGVVRPSVAVLSLNPHAGDGGLLGSEEEEIIKPALASLMEKGYIAMGPFPADGFFGHGAYKKFDGVLAMYHDQGLAPFKTIAYNGGVNYSASLPFVRTSPDHGTAYDIAWQGKADPSSMRDAIYMAIDIFRRRKSFMEASANPLKKHVHERPEKSERFDKGPHRSEHNKDIHNREIPNREIDD